jgi:hypothetical protein
MAELTDEHRAILDFERAWWRYPGAKDAEIRERFDLSPTRYYQALNTLIDDPAALEHDPMLVRRLQRIRNARARARSGDRAGRTG